MNFGVSSYRAVTSMKARITGTFIYFCKKETNVAIRIFLQSSKRYNDTIKRVTNISKVASCSGFWSTLAKDRGVHTKGHSSLMEQPSVDRNLELKHQIQLPRPPPVPVIALSTGLTTYKRKRKSIVIILERFSNDCRKTKTKAVTPTNHNRSRQRDEPITIPSNYL